MTGYRILKLATLALSVLVATTSAQEAQATMQSPLPSPIPPGLHALPPDINFANRELHAEWRPIAEAEYVANRDFAFKLREARAMLEAAPRSARRNGRIAFPLEQQCVLHRLIAEAGSLDRVARDQQARLFSLTMRYGSQLSVNDADSLGHRIQDSILSSQSRASDLVRISEQIDDQFETQCAERRFRQRWNTPN